MLIRVALIFGVLSTCCFAQGLVGNALAPVSTDTNYAVPFSKPARVDFQITFLETFHYRGPDGARDGNPFDHSHARTFFIDTNDYSVHSFSVDSQITIDCTGPDRYFGIAHKLIQFELDTAAKIVRNCYVDLDLGSSASRNRLQFLIAEIPYQVIWNHHLFASSSGPDLYRQFLSVAYDSLFAEPSGAPGQITERRWNSRQLGSDSVSCYFSMDLASTDPLYGVKGTGTSASSFLRIQVDYSSRQILFQFDASARARLLRCFDILGRPVRSEVISPGETSVLLPSTAFSHNFYVAELDGQMSKFWAP